MDSLWYEDALPDGDHPFLLQALGCIESSQSEDALALAARCRDSDAKTLVQAYACHTGGNEKAVIPLVAPLFLKDNVALREEGSALALALMLRAAQAEDPELFEILNEQTAVHGEPRARVVKSFFFGGLVRDKHSLYQRVLEGQQRLSRRTETIRTIRPLAHRIEFLKHYSSYTPLTELSDTSLGGGYFLVADGFGCVIDPGYDFLSNFRKRYSIADIDAVIVTHCHDDHNADLPALLSLLYRQKPPREVQLYLDRGTFNAYQHLILSSEHVRKPCEPISAPFCGWPGNAQPIMMAKNISMQPIPAFHRVTRDDKGDSAVGLHFVLRIADRECHLLISGDTAWNPEPMCKVYRSFSKYRPVLVAHVSTACSNEAKGVLQILRGGYHANHLGVRGTAEMIKACCPSRIVLSEIGEEMRDCVHDLAKLIELGFRIPCSVGMMGDRGGEIVSLVPPCNGGDMGGSSH